jgi:hypothetical protein
MGSEWVEERLPDAARPPIHGNQRNAHFMGDEKSKRKTPQRVALEGLELRLRRKWPKCQMAKWPNFKAKSTDLQSQVSGTKTG